MNEPNCTQGDDSTHVPAPKENYQAPTVSSVGPGDNPHYALLGGEETITRLVDHFYNYMCTLPEAATVRAMHPDDLTPLKQTLVRFLSEWTGGPALYSVERGHPRLRRRHLHLSIGPSEANAWMMCMTRALEDVVESESMRASLAAAFAKTADFMRNDAGHVHAQHNQEFGLTPLAGRWAQTTRTKR